MPKWSPLDWRDAGAYAAVLAGGRPALAWELLRRDPGYRKCAVGAGAKDKAVARWGLHFRG